MAIAFNNETLEELERICARYPRREAALLPALRLLEREFGHVSEPGMVYIAKLIGVSPAKVFGVVTFYTHYLRPSDGKHVMQVCATLPCALRGGLDLYRHLSKNLGIKHGETTPDRLFTLKKVECLANCDKAPCLQVGEHYFDKLAPDTVDAMVDEMRKGRWKPVEMPYVVPKTKHEPILLKHVLEPGSNTLEHYVARGGYKAAEKAFKEYKPYSEMGGADGKQIVKEGLIDLVKRSGLRGRGGAGFPTGLKWSFVPHPSKNPKPRYLVCNADESEPGTFKDKMLIERDPHQLLEGIIISAYACTANAAYIYIRGEFGLGATILQRAIDEAYKGGYLGENVMGTGFKLDVTVHRGAGAYICGEETGLLSSLEGGRGYPKIKPPFPAVEGLFRCPTVVNNVETIATVPHIVMKGVDWFRSMGTAKSPGPKILSVAGHVERPGNFEVPLGIPFAELLELAGGVRGGKKLKAVVPGGSSAKILTAEEAMKVNMDFDALGAAGSMLGSGGVIVMDEDTCMVDAVWNLMRFYHHESCGQCTPCREGTGWLEKICERLENGHGREDDLKLLYEVGDNMCGRTICVLADAAAWPAQSYSTKFKAEFEEHIRLKRCPFKKSEAHVPAGAH